MRSTTFAGGFAVVLGMTLVAAFSGLLASNRAEGLPQYAAREGRTCDNCHVDPSGWTNPDVFDRQCSLACSVCHVDPTGGGMRTAAGYYYGIQTLSAIGATRRPWGDDTWYFLAREWEAPAAHGGELGDAPDSQPSSQPTSQPTIQPSGTSGESSSDQPPSSEEGDREPWLGNLAWGTGPANGSSQWAWEQGRYGSILADPFFAIGADFRLAFYFTNGNGDEAESRFSVFPMQLDLSAKLHPVEHLSLYVEGGGQSTRGGFALGDRVGDQADEDVDPFGLHELFLMTHEWPANAYLKAGRFVPPFGTRLDDHTAFVRRDLGFDQGRPDAYVSGVEIGAVANYPYINAAVFQLNAGQTGFLPDHGTGFSAITGYRDLWWGAGGSFYRADSDEDGGRTMYGATWYFNPWALVRNLPLTYMGELDFVHLSPLGQARTVQQVAAFHELDWAIIAGMYMRMRYDFLDPDLDVADDGQHRLSIQFDLFPIRFAELQLLGRILFPPVGDLDGDFLAIVRFWY